MSPDKDGTATRKNVSRAERRTAAKKQTVFSTTLAPFLHKPQQQQHGVRKTRQEGRAAAAEEFIRAKRFDKRPAQREIGRETSYDLIV